MGTDPKHGLAETGPYILRTLIEDVPLLSEDSVSSGIEITCVELWEENLYVGTSAAELLHFVLIPPDPNDTSANPTFILASRLQPAFTPSATSTVTGPGVQQIAILPRANKACILCNGTLTFYSLPELSPAFGPTQVRNCSYVGGVDLNLRDVEQAGTEDEVVMISIKSRIRLVRVGQEARAVKNIEFGGSLISIRRDAFACVADSTSYALLDVDHQQKIPLFPISSIGSNLLGPVGGGREDMPEQAMGTSEYAERGHGRSTSLGVLSQLGRRQRSPRSQSAERAGLEDQSSSLGESSPAPLPKPGSPQRRIASPVPSPKLQAPSPPIANTVPLTPHVLSPSPQEFLLTTGTTANDPGVGIFVNLDGDVSRGTLEFSKYPKALVVDGRGIGTEDTGNFGSEEEEGFVLSVIQGDSSETEDDRIDVQRWDVEAGDRRQIREVVNLASIRASGNEKDIQKLNIAKTITKGNVSLDELKEKLQLQKLRLAGHTSPKGTPLSIRSTDSRTKASLERVSKEMELFEPQGLAEESTRDREREASRRLEEEQFASRFNKLQSRIVIWSGNRIFWAVRNPLAVRLDARLGITELREGSLSLFSAIDNDRILELLKNIQNQEARTETEYLSLQYIRQKASVLLLARYLAILLLAPEGADNDREGREVEKTLMDSGLDPRVAVALIPLLREEVVEGREGIWIHGGIQHVAESYLSASSEDSARFIPEEILELFRHYLTAWRRKKGFGSITDEKEVSQTVDAALLHTLLQADYQAERSNKPTSNIRVKLYAVVDQGVDCFHRAVELLEHYRHLYVLSRLYQSRRMAREVLTTWKRILDGSPNEGGEFTEGEMEMKNYLGRIRDAALVEEFGSWLAHRNAKLGIQVFADEQSKVKFEPTRVVELLQKKAPSAVKEYLEYLVFGQKNAQYVNELIAFYLDDVLSVLQSSEPARATLSASYETYRALRPPKPTYRQFITDNAIPDEWWHNRLRLLQLIGGSHGAASDYDVETILTRLEPFEQQLVPEMIILDGRQARHPQALRLLVHGLGDYSTAVSYCLLGGSSIYHPSSGAVPPSELPSREEQAALFTFLLTEFLQIEDISDRVEQTAILLERFGGWFDIEGVLRMIPDSWSVELVSGFLMRAMRRLVQERHETMIAKSLSGAENLSISADLVERIDRAGATIEAVE